MQTGAYVLLLADMTSNRRLPIMIGPAEAQSIAMVLENVNATRPMTHDLFRSFCEAFDVHFTEVVIDRFVNGNFLSSIYLNGPKGLQVLDARTSDAVALAIRFSAPIYTLESIMEAAEKGDNLTTDENFVPPHEQDLSDFSIDELKDMLDVYVEKEEFDFASRLRDEIQKREDEKDTQKLN